MNSITVVKPVPGRADVYLNGQRVEGLESYSIEADINKHTTITLTLQVRTLEVVSKLGGQRVGVTDT